MTVLERLRELPCDNAECKGICQLCGVYLGYCESDDSVDWSGNDG